MSPDLALSLPIPTLLVQLLLLLTLPIALGMWMRQRRTDLAVAYQPLLQRLSFVGVALVLLLIVLDDPRAFFGGLSTIVPLVAAFVVCSTAAGWATAAVITADPRDRFTLAVEFGTRNLGVAMAIAVTLARAGRVRPRGLHLFPDRDAVDADCRRAVSAPAPRRHRAGRLIPSLAMRVSSVLGLSPSRSAAPPVPRTRQPALSSVLRMWSRSTSSSASLR